MKAVRPFIGEIVHWVGPNGVRPAIVANVEGFKSPLTASLVIFSSFGTDPVRREFIVPHESEAGDQQDFWRRVSR